MAVRRWAVGPDPATGMVDRRVLIEAIMDGEALMWRAGGVMTVVVGRAPTDLPGEMVTTSAVIEWKDRTDAKQQPERPGDVLPSPVVEPVSEPVDGEEDDDPLAVGVEIDPLLLEEEDVSSIPEHVR